MQHKAKTALAAAALICLIPLSALAITPYQQDFEELVQSDPFALANDGWLVYGNVFTPAMVYIYGYGAFDAPNDGFGFCQIDLGQGGDDQGAQQLSVFSDYNNGDHAAGNWVESNTYQEMDILAEDVGTTWKFEFHHKRGNIEGTSTALAFIKTLDPADGWATTNFISVDMTSIPETWGGHTLSIDIDAGLEGQKLQIGFQNTATLYASAGIFYDNINFYLFDPTGVEDMPLVGAKLQPNYPNPFNPMTRIDFSLENAGPVDVTVFDLAGRRIATLHRGDLPAGSHHVTWNGSTDDGTPAAAGQYRYVLQTATGRTSRGMILVK